MLDYLECAPPPHTHTHKHAQCNKFITGFKYVFQTNFLLKVGDSAGGMYTIGILVVFI